MKYIILLFCSFSFSTNEQKCNIIFENYLSNKSFNEIKQIWTNFKYYEGINSLIYLESNKISYIHQYLIATERMIKELHPNEYERFLKEVKNPIISILSNGNT